MDTPDTPLEQLPLFPAEKRCARCHKVKLVTEFGRSRAQKDGRQGYCKRCRAVDPAEYDRRQILAAQGLRRCVKCKQDIPRASFRSGYCRDCTRAMARAAYACSPEPFKQRARDYYHSHKDRVAEWGYVYRRANAARRREQDKRYRTEHREQERARLAAYYRQHRAVVIARARDWRQRHRDAYRRHMLCARHRRRARERDNGGAFTRRDIAVLLDVQRGQCAYCQIALGARFHIEHMTPVSRGGSNDLANLCVACARCDRKKHTRSAGEYLAMLIKERRAAVRGQLAV